VSYVLAILGLMGACVLWYAVQRWAGTGERPLCREAEPDCEECDLEDVDRSGSCTPRLVAQGDGGERGTLAEK
jgi:hypothetical protein